MRARRPRLPHSIRRRILERVLSAVHEDGVAVALPSARYLAPRRNPLGKPRQRVYSDPKPLSDLAPNLKDSQRRACPKCERPMLVRRSKTLKVFWSCPRFPVCKGSGTISQSAFLRWTNRNR